MTPYVLTPMTSPLSLPSIAIRATAMTATAATDNEYVPFNEDEFLLSSVRDYWSSFPCPPPWRPALLTEVNTSKLGPQLTGVVIEFLTGKCQLHSTAYPDTRLRSGIGIDEENALRPDNSSTIAWCDRKCQLAIVVCSAVFITLVIASVVFICFTRVRRPHKMAATRPSRQQLQLSTSTSDAVNWAEFSNTQIHVDEDMIYPPFRHRGLPSPPSRCPHPSCDPKWNCPACSSCHPLMRMSPSVVTCSHGYTAVYETIDDEEDDATVTANCADINRISDYQENNGLGMTTTMTTSTDATDVQCSSNCHTINPNVEGESPSIMCNNLNRPAEQPGEAETGFNGEDATNKWPRYFELDPANYDGSLVNHTHSINRNTSLKSFQSPHHDKWGFHPVMASSSFGKSPHSSPMACNQLCATCVPNLVSMSPCVSISRQNGYIPSNKVFNVNSYPQQSFTSASNSYHFPPSPINHDNRQQQAIKTADIPQLSNVDETRLAEGRYYFNQVCDFSQPAQTAHHSSRYEYDQSQPICQIPVRQRHSKEETQMLETAMWQPCSPTINGSPTMTPPIESAVSSPSRHWCPTCQQVPLLDQNIAHSRHNSAYDNEESDGGNAFGITAWRQHACNGMHTQSDTRTTTHRTCDDDEGYNNMDSQSTNGENSSKTERSRNHDDLDGHIHKSLNNILQKTWLQELAQEPKTTQHLVDRAKTDNSGNVTRISEPSCPRVLALHSMYFDNTSTA